MLSAYNVADSPSLAVQARQTTSSAAGPPTCVARTAPTAGSPRRRRVARSAITVARSAPTAAAARPPSRCPPPLLKPELTLTLTRNNSHSNPNPTLTLTRCTTDEQSIRERGDESARLPSISLPVCSSRRKVLTHFTRRFRTTWISIVAAAYGEPCMDVGAARK